MIPMASTPTTGHPPPQADRSFERQLREMNEALLVYSVQQQELAEQAQVADALVRDSEERYRTLFDLVPVAVYSCDTSGVIQKFNRRAAELWDREPASGDTDERFCGSFKLFRPDGSLMPYEQCPMAEVLSGKISELRDAEVLIERPDGSRLTVLVNIRPLKTQRGELTGAINCFYDITERNRVQEHNKLLMAEVTHRAKNLLGVVLAVARQTAKHSDPATFVARLSERIHGLAASHDLMAKNEWHGVEVSDLVEAQLAHFKDLIGTRVLLDGPPVRLTPTAAQGVGMALHELATNAAKYGALSNREGRVRIFWQVAVVKKPTFLISWLEEGGPTVAAPTRTGFGQMVIGSMAEAAVHGIAETDYRESGFSWKLSAPVADALEGGRVASFA
jgi:PAS domain S-box-containing protein